MTEAVTRGGWRVGMIDEVFGCFLRGRALQCACWRKPCLIPSGPGGPT